MSPREAHVVEERSFWLDINGRRLDVWGASPGQEQALAVGRLLTDGYIRHAGDLLSCTVEESGTTPGAGVRARVPEDRVAIVEAERRHRREEGCGVSHFAVCEPALLVRRRELRVPPLHLFASLFRELYQPLQGEAMGGKHHAALTNGIELLFRIEEIGRHNAVDKVIGLAVLADAPLSHLGLLVSARISGLMAVKAARAGVAWVASRSVPTTAAVAVAAAAGLPLVARAPGDTAAVLGGRQTPSVEM